MFGLGVPEILIIALIILLIFGAKRLPGIGEGIGKTVKEIKGIKKEISGVKESAEKESAEKESAEKAWTGEEAASEEEEESIESKLVESVQKKVTDSFKSKVTDKVIGQVPGIKQAKQIKDTAEKIKKFIS
jgi:sec-independent protein translocase protein TatA